MLICHHSGFEVRKCFWNLGELTVYDPQPCMDLYNNHDVYKSILSGEVIKAKLCSKRWLIAWYNMPSGSHFLLKWNSWAMTVRTPGLLISSSVSSSPHSKEVVQFDQYEVSTNRGRKWLPEYWTELLHRQQVGSRKEKSALRPSFVDHAQSVGPIISYLYL